MDVIARSLLGRMDKWRASVDVSLNFGVTAARHLDSFELQRQLTYNGGHARTLLSQGSYIPC